MKLNEAQRVIKKTERKRNIAVIAMVLAIFIVIAIDTSFSIPLAIAVFIVGNIIAFKISSVKYILYKECNPKLYETVVKDLVKQVPKNQHVAEFTGNYTEALRLNEELYKKAKNKYATLEKLNNESRLYFSMGNYEKCKNSAEQFNSLAQGNKINRILTVSNEFFLAFTSGEYEVAKKKLEELNQVAKRREKPFECRMLYYRGIVELKLGNKEQAEEMFQSVIDNYPNMFYAVASRNYLDTTDGVIPEFTSYEPQERTDSAQNVKPQKSSKLKLIIGLAALAVAIILLAYNSDTVYFPTAVEAIESFEAEAVKKIDYTLNVDDNHQLCIFTSEDRTGVAYLTEKNREYSCGMASLESDEIGKSFVYSRMKVSGKSSEVVYGWELDKNNAPEDFKTIDLRLGDQTVYFCYQMKKPRYHFSNLYSIKHLNMD